MQKRNSGQPNLYLKIPHRPTEQDSDEFHRQLRTIRGKCFQIVLDYQMQNAFLPVFPIPTLPSSSANVPAPLHVRVQPTLQPQANKEAYGGSSPVYREMMMGVHTYHPFRT